MKKLLASGLILTMLASVGIGCFAAGDASNESTKYSDYLLFNEDDELDAAWTSYGNRDDYKKLRIEVQFPTGYCSPRQTFSTSFPEHQDLEFARICDPLSASGYHIIQGDIHPDLIYCYEPEYFFKPKDGFSDLEKEKTSGVFRSPNYYWDEIAKRTFVCKLQVKVPGKMLIENIGKTISVNGINISITEVK